jgi:ankyrin repeat protein
LLVNKGAELNEQCLQYGSTPLHYACHKGLFEIVKCLREKGATLNIRDKDGYTPLDLARRAKHLRIVEYLREFAN